MAKFLIILKDQSNLMGKVKNKTINIKTMVGPLEISPKKIMNIIFKNPPYYQEDEIRLINSDGFKGEITNKTISFKPDSAKLLEIPKDNVVSIAFLPV